MKCANCGSEHWECVDQYRFKEVDKKGKKINMSICKDCGFVSYPDKWQSKEEIYKHYKSDYRQAPSALNLFTCQRKNHFHVSFLKDLFEAWNKAGKDAPVICDIGTAFGMSLGMFKTLIPDARVYGTELTTTMKRVAYHEFGFDLTDEIDETIKYDMIMSYKVLEHQLDPIEELKKFYSLLNDDGVLYISVPTWFNVLSNFGLEGFDLEYYYDVNHINVWSKEIFENILSRAGFEIIKQDHIMYGDTYLCKKNESLKSTEVLKLDYKTIIDKLDKIKKAYDLYTDYKFEDAIKTWSDYPGAWVSILEMNRKLLAEKGFHQFELEFINPMIGACPTSPEVLISATDYAMRAKEYLIAIEYANRALLAKPNNPVSIGQLATIHKEIAIRSQNEADKIEHFNRAKHFATSLLDTSLQNRDDAISNIYFLNSLIPTPSESKK